MATFGEEQEMTAGKMSDLVMEYVSQFIARDFHEAYEKSAAEERYEFVPKEFDEKMFKKINKLERKGTGRRFRGLFVALGIVAAAVCAACIAFTVMVLINSPLRQEALHAVLPFLDKL